MKSWLAAYHDGKEPKDFVLSSAEDKQWLENQMKDFDKKDKGLDKLLSNCDPLKADVAAAFRLEAAEVRKKLDGLSGLFESDERDSTGAAVTKALVTAFAKCGGVATLLAIMIKHPAEAIRMQADELFCKVVSTKNDEVTKFAPRCGIYLLMPMYG